MLADTVISIIAATRKIPIENITTESTFEELGIDSLDSLEIVFQLEEAMKIWIPDDEIQEIRSVREVIDRLQPLLDQGIATLPAPAAA